MRSRTLREIPKNFLINQDHPLAQGLIFAGLGRVSGSNKYLDSSRFGNHGTLTNMNSSSDYVWDNKLNRWCMDFDGTNDYIKIPSTTALNGTYFSCTAWVSLLPAGTQFPRIIDRVYNGQFAFYLYEYGTPAAWIVSAAILTTGGSSDWGSSGLAGSPTIRDSSWIHLTIVFDGVDILLYVNGSYMGKSGAPDGVLVTSSSMIYIGQRVDPAASRAFEGKISDVIVYNRVLSAIEVQQIADPSNVMLSGLIQPPKRRLYTISRQIGTPYKKQYFVFNAGNNFIKVGG